MKLLVSSLVFLLVFSACSSFRQLGIKVAEEEFKNYYTTKEMAEMYRVVWPCKSGMIREVLGANINMLPKDTLDAMDRLDKWAALPSKKMTDEMWCASLVAHAKVMNRTMKTLLDLYAPGLFELLIGLR